MPLTPHHEQPPSLLLLLGAEPSSPLGAAHTARQLFVDEGKAVRNETRQAAAAFSAPLPFVPYLAGVFLTSR